MIKHFNLICYHSLKMYSYIITIQTMSKICHVLQAHNATNVELVDWLFQLLFFLFIQHEYTFSFHLMFMFSSGLGQLFQHLEQLVTAPFIWTGRGKRLLEFDLIPWHNVRSFYWWFPQSTTGRALQHLERCSPKDLQRCQRNSQRWTRDCLMWCSNL